MSAKDKYGYTYIYEDLTLSNRNESNREYFVYYHLEENDGATFLNRGPETEIIIDISPKASIDYLENVLKLSIHDEAKKVIKHKISSIK